MNVYDFDKTIYSGDSSLDFYFFCLKSKPLLVRYIPIQLFWFVIYMFGLCDKIRFKEKYFSFIKAIDTKDIVEKFWDKNITNIKSWYIRQKNKNDIIVSASPEFLVSSCMKRLSVENCICTVVSEEDGAFLSPNCYGDEKLKRFRELYNTRDIDLFYSDSLSDSVMADNSKNAYFVSGNQIINWNANFISKWHKIKTALCNPEFFRFLFVGVVNFITGIFFSWLFLLLSKSASVSFVLGYLLSLTCSYLLNSNMVFKKKISFTKYVKFCVSYIPNFLIQDIIVFITHSVINLNAIVSYLIAGIIAFPVTFVLLKFRVFKSK